MKKSIAQRVAYYVRKVSQYGRRGAKRIEGRNERLLSYKTALYARIHEENERSRMLSGPMGEYCRERYEAAGMEQNKTREWNA